MKLEYKERKIFCSKALLWAFILFLRNTISFPCPIYASTDLHSTHAKYTSTWYIFAVKTATDQSNPKTNEFGCER